MASDPFTIRIFVPDGDPEGVRVIDRMNWTGRGIAFPREGWPSAKNRNDLESAGVYILGSDDQGRDNPTLYVGQSDNLTNRIERHAKDKDFWEWGVAFISTNDGLNRAHITWLEHALIDLAHRADSSTVLNVIAPLEPTLTEAEKADTLGFLKEILQILPLVGLRAFEVARSTKEDASLSDQLEPEITKIDESDRDMIIVPAKKDGFQRVFLGENAWHAIRIADGKRQHLNWIAAYQTYPTSAITHVAEVDRIEPYRNTGKCILYFRGPAQELERSIPFGDATSGAMQGPRYTTKARFDTAQAVSDLI